MIIGVSGKKQHGKDTVAKIIQYLSMVQSLSYGNMKLFDEGPVSSKDPLFHFNIFTNLIYLLNGMIKTELFIQN
jgi:hypothetical protein